MTEPLPSDTNLDNPTLEQALLEAALHSRQQGLTWLGLYISIETMAWTDPALSHPEIAAQFEINTLLVERALKLLKVLNPASRSLLAQNLLQSSSPRIPESAVFQLAGLGNEPLLVEAALQQVVLKRMSEAESKQLVDWMKAGNKAETFDASAKAGLIELRTSKSASRPSKVTYF
jgi:hypothetical protein